MANKKLILIISLAVIISASFGFVREALAKYYSSGTLVSTNLLLGQTVVSIDSFDYNASSIPSGTALKVQFSQDNINWYNSSGTLNGYDTLSQGSHNIDLSGLSWSGPNFYYRAIFESNVAQDATPVLDSIGVNYTSAVCSSLNYPTDKWQRVWYDYPGGNCLGDGPDETTEQFDNDWGSGTIAHGRSDNIQFTSSRKINFASAGNYRFTVGSDDGIRLWIDGELKIDQWVDRGYTTNSVDVSLTAGNHDFRIDYYENGESARVSFSYSFLVSSPTVITNAASSITGTTATLNGNITDTGGENASERGFEWGTSPGSYPNSWTETGSFGTGTFSHNISGLSPGQTYYFRAKAQNSAGWAYGSEMSFPTGAITPTIATSDATSVEETVATLNGDITDIGGENCDQRGFEWDIDSGEPYANSWTESGSFDTGVFSHNLDGLAKGTLYYFRAKAHNSEGWGYGSELKFLTWPAPPTDFTADPGDGQITLSWTKGEGANRTLVRRRTNTYPSTITDGYEVYFGTGTSVVDTGLTNGQTYYYRAWSEITVDDPITAYSGGGGGAGGADVSDEPSPPPPCSNHNVWGWAWSENTGWVSFACGNCDSDFNGITDTGNYPQCPIGQNVSDYGVDIDEATGELSGYAWSEHIGWITFNSSELGGCPVPPCKAEVNMETGEVSGWARALVDGGGWSGWLRLRNTGYETWIDATPSPSEFRDFAWSDMVLGWTSFNRINCDPDKDGTTEGGANNPDFPSCPDGESISDYKVLTSVSFVPTPTVYNLDDFFTDPCAQSRIPTLSWDTDATKPYDFEIEIDDDPSFGSPNVTETILSTNSTSWSPACSYCCDVAPYNSIAWGGNTYHWRVRARNTGGKWSDWVVDSDGFLTFDHCYPFCNFLCDGVDCSTIEPHEGEAVVLTDDSSYYNGKDHCTWILPSGATVVEGDENFDCEISVEFLEGDDQPITLNVFDTHGYSCPTTKTINVSILLPLPEWKEIKPF